MCRVLKISRSAYYYKPVKKNNTDILEQPLKKIFKDSRNNYGTRKIKFELFKLNYVASRGKTDWRTEKRYWKLGIRQKVDDIDKVINYFNGLNPEYESIKEAFYYYQNRKIKLTYFEISVFKKRNITLNNIR